MRDIAVEKHREPELLRDSLTENERCPARLDDTFGVESDQRNDVSRTDSRVHAVLLGQVDRGGRNTDSGDERIDERLSGTEEHVDRSSDRETEQEPADDV